ncbi:ADP-ribose pyrophosphatase [Tetrabaena socialis]|uniref:ADP-ribose pyrophosphatase n=1 Tax=Tetrabaena socialis TaxID=47790 RepID=A0A2J8AC52_9CHLO|nr:ADP-ribose pyrophosphatase [Tetrabaena socialis]|eukprot:PNH10108.1 ADP-ribose pyrophosphatase [Tetrabaena socialis]
MRSARLAVRGPAQLLFRGRRPGVSCMAGEDAHTYKYPRPAVTVDTVIVAARPGNVAPAQMLLIKRKNPPFKDCWALPGGFVDEGEGLDAAAGRELKEETSVDPSSVALTQVGAFGDPGRDPRGWTVTVAYAALVPSTNMGVKAADDAKEARWFDVANLPQLAFDHKLVVRSALRHLAKSPAAAAMAGLPASLEAAAVKLEGPWQTTEQPQHVPPKRTKGGVQPSPNVGFLLASRKKGSDAGKQTEGPAIQAAHPPPKGHTYEYPRPAVTVDTIVVAVPTEDEPAQILLIRRRFPPFKDCWALPGGFVDEGEGLDPAAGRELQEETSVDPSSVALTQVGAFGDPGRDPRGWTVTVAYAALVPSTNMGVKAADDAQDARWFDVGALPQLAFDHRRVVRAALRHLAKSPAAAAVADLAASLEAAAAKLEGPGEAPAAK